jgi:Ca2+-binding RTX toxin-like protein
MAEFEAIARDGDEFVVNTKISGDQNEPRVVRLDSGGFVVVWTDRVNWSQQGDIKAQIYDVSGAKVGGEIMVNGAPLNDRTPDVGRLEGGGFVVTWSQDGGYPAPWSVRGQVFDAAGAKVGSEFTTLPTAGHGSVDVTGLPGGGFVAVTKAGAGQVHNAAGAPAGPAFTVGTSGQYGAVVTTLADGRFAVAVGQHSTSKVFVQLFDGAGTKLGGEKEATAVSRGDLTITGLHDGGFVVGWTAPAYYPDDADEAMAQIFDSSGNKVGASIRLNTTMFGVQADPALTGLPGGGFLATWDEKLDWRTPERQVMGQLFDAAGNKVGPEFLVSTPGENMPSHGDSEVTLIGGERIVAVWSGVGAGDTDGGILAQIFTEAEGTPPVPVARPDHFVTDEATAIGGNLFADNGAGPDTGGERSITAVNGSTVAVGQQITLASGARLTVASNGGFAYDPAGAFNALVPGSTGATNRQAADSFTYTITGGSTATATALVHGLFSAGDEYHGSTYTDSITGTADANLFIIDQQDFSPDNEDTVRALGGDDEIRVGTQLRPRMRIDGGDGFDSIVMKGGGGAVSASNLVNIERIAALPADSGTANFVLEFTDAMLAAGRTLIIDTSALNATDRMTALAGGETGAAFVLVGGAAPDRIEAGAGADLLSGGGGTDRLSGGGGNDRLDAGSGDDILSGGDGDDVLFYGAFLDRQDLNTGGAGTDTVVLQGHYPALLLGASSFSGIEGVSLQSGTIARWGQSGTNSYDYDLTTDQANVAAGQQLRVNAQSLTAGEDFAFSGSAETDGGAFQIYAGYGVDTLTGGAGNDQFIFVAGRFGTGDRVNGGGGNDAAVISGAPAGSSGPVAVAIPMGTFTSVEALSFNGRFANDPDVRPSYDVALADGNVAADGSLIVNGSSLEAGQALGFDGSAVSGGTLVIYGGAGADTLTGGGADDRISGGGLGDSLRGGGGADRFEYRDVSDSAGAGTDAIRDFELGVDRIDLSAIDADPSATGDQAFSWLGGEAFTGKAGELRVFHDPAAGWWTVIGDVDGDMEADFQLFVATAGAAPAASDFLL